jgi:phage/plasmid-like protein (TIGR03299 family)
LLLLLIEVKKLTKEKEFQMAAEIESMFYVGQKPWHGLGTVIQDGFISPKEALTLAGLNWKVETEPCFLSDGTRVPKTMITRRDTDKSILGTVGDRYHPLQNEDAFNWFEPFIESRSASFETAGSLKDGKVVWVLAKTNIPKAEVCKNDVIDSYILLSHSHDGTLSIRGGFTPIRVVCNNTLSMSHKNASSKLLRMKHTKNSKIAMEKVREIMDIANSDFIATIEQYKYLASKAINKKDLERYITLSFNNSDDAEKELRKSTIERVEYLFEHGQGHELAGKTYWGAYQAANEYLNYEKGRTQDNRLHNLWFGTGVEQNNKMLQVATDMATGLI